MQSAQHLHFCLLVFTASKFAGMSQANSVHIGQRTMKNLTKIVSLLILSLAMGYVSANPKPPRDGKPPREAIEACVDKSEGDVVTFETPRGDQLEATCKLMEEQLVAVPEHHKKRRDRN